MFELELRGRGDIQLFRVEVPGPRITRDIASDAKVRLSIPRTEFNELAKDGSIRALARGFESGHVKATGPPEILKRGRQAGRAHPHAQAQDPLAAPRASRTVEFAEIKVSGAVDRSPDRGR